jgi:hypothetical protein
MTAGECAGTVRASIKASALPLMQANIVNLIAGERRVVAGPKTSGRIFVFAGPTIADCPSEQSMNRLDPLDTAAWPFGGRPLATPQLVHHCCPALTKPNISERARVTDTGNHPAAVKEVTFANLLCYISGVCFALHNSSITKILPESGSLVSHKQQAGALNPSSRARQVCRSRKTQMAQLHAVRGSSFHQT